MKMSVKIDNASKLYFYIGMCFEVSVLEILRADCINMISDFIFNYDSLSEPVLAAMHGPHSLVRIGPGCADRA